jgi:hypothetical protein
VFLNCSTCFGRHTAYHQELKDCNCSLWFYIRLWLPVAAMAEPSQRPATINACITAVCVNRPFAHIIRLVTCERFQRSCWSPGPWLTFHSMFIFYGELLAPRSPHMLEDYPLSVVHDCLFCVFRSCPQYQVAASNCNLRTCHAVVTRPRCEDKNRLSLSSIMEGHVLDSCDSR